MQERFIEFQNELKQMDLSQYSEKDLKKWHKQWDSYISKGGVRPPKPH